MGMGPEFRGRGDFGISDGGREGGLGKFGRPKIRPEKCPSFIKYQVPFNLQFCCNCTIHTRWSVKAVPTVK